MRDIKVVVINTTEQIGHLVDRLVFRHAPPDPYLLTMYIDLEGVYLCHEDSFSILTLMIDTRIPTRRVCLFRCAFAGRTRVQYRRRKTEDTEGYFSGRQDP